MTVSILILTKNEEQDLPGCLESVAWSDDIHVLDSESTDATRAIALRYGASVAVRKFDDYSQQRNAGLKLLFRHPWLLIVDADERIPSALVQEIRQAVVAPSDSIVGFSIRRRDIFLDTWLKHAQASPYYIRLVRPARVAYTPRQVNEVLEPCAGGRIGRLKEPFDHYPFSKGIAHWFAKHNTYSTMEAREILRDRPVRFRLSVWQAFFGGDFHQRRIHQKELFYRLPFRPTLKFILLYLCKGGFLDGRAGLLYCQMQMCYERMILVKSVVQKREAQLARDSAVSARLPAPSVSEAVPREK